MNGDHTIYGIRVDIDSGITEGLSKDDGATWAGNLLLDARHSSYPDGFQAEDGTIYINFDHDRSGAAEILNARFT